MPFFEIISYTLKSNTVKQGIRIFGGAVIPVDQQGPHLHSCNCAIFIRILGYAEPMFVLCWAEPCEQAGDNLRERVGGDGAQNVEADMSNISIDSAPANKKAFQQDPARGKTWTLPLTRACL